MKAKVDIQKLQVLCDRINQTADALAQVRMSVSGLAHTGPISPYGLGFNPTVGFILPYYNPQTLPQLPLQPVQMPVAGFGLQHSVDPRQGNVYGTTIPIGYGESFGIRHSGVDEMERRFLEAQANDPYRLSRTFPFVFFGGPSGLR